MHREIILNNLVLLSVNPVNLIFIDRVLLDCNLSNIKYNAAENYKKKITAQQCHVNAILRYQYLSLLKNGKTTNENKKKSEIVTGIKKTHWNAW